MLLQLLAAATTNKADFGKGIEPLSPIYSPSTDPASNLELIVSTLLGTFTVVAGLFFVVYFFLGALKWVTAAGDSGKVSKARDEMVQGVMGLVVIVLAYSLLGLVGRIVGLDLLNVAKTINCLVPGGKC